MSTRFDGLAERYRQYRPDYPEAAMAAIGVACRQGRFADRVALDIGAGTGISTRALAAELGPDWRILAVEPGGDMRRTAERDLDASTGIAVVDGTAEALPAADGSVAAVLTAQALHWFDRAAFYAEAGRVLGRHGFLFVLYNDRVAEAPLIQAFDALMEAETPGYSRDYRSFDYPAEIAGLDWAAEVAGHAFPWVWRITTEAFAGLMLSRSLSKPWVAAVGETAAHDRLITLAGAHAEAGGLVPMPYVTRLTRARRA